MVVHLVVLGSVQVTEWQVASVILFNKIWIWDRACWWGHTRSPSGSGDETQLLNVYFRNCKAEPNFCLSSVPELHRWSSNDVTSWSLTVHNMFPKKWVKKKNIFQQLTSWKALNGQMIEIFYFLPLHLIHSSPYVEGGEGGAVRVSGCVHGWSGERAVSGIRIHPVWTCCQCIVHYESACPQICSGKFSGSRRKDLMSRSQNSSENSDWACGKLTELKRRYLVVINNIIYTYIY